MLRIISKVFILLVTVTFLSCNSNSGVTSRATGWKYDFKAEGAFRNTISPASSVPSGMVKIPGGTITIDDIDDYETVQSKARPNELNSRRTLSVNTFYMDEYEIRNIDWREYLAWLTAVYGNVAPEIIEKAKPDMKAWKEEMGENEPFMTDYFTHPAFNEYPVVCISWEQAADYCAWRTDRANELRLIKQGVIKAPDFNAIAAMTDLESVQKAVFSSKTFFNGSQDNLAATYSGMYPDFRLPTEDEWEYAAYARKSTDPENKVRIYPWSTPVTGKLSALQQAQKKANYNKNAAENNANAFARTVPVGEYAPNDFGLYNMAGNVNEWVYDRYASRGNLNKIDSIDVLDTFLPVYYKNPGARVYKGGSWKDPVYWLRPASRRALDQKSAANDVGFRCVMSGIPSASKK